jgi:c-di-AMP phosphodiesterase-like protein
MQNGSESEISALENAPFGVLLYDDNQIIQYVNKYFTKLFTTKLQGKTLQQMDASIAEFVRDSKNSSPVQINWSNKKFLISVDKTSNTIYFQNIERG